MVKTTWLQLEERGIRLAHRRQGQQRTQCPQCSAERSTPSKR